MSLLWLPLLLLAAVPGEPSFEWVAPSSCPTEEMMRPRVGATTSDVQATVREMESGFELTVIIDGQGRTLRTPSCNEAADTAVFLIELAGRSPVNHRKVVAPPASASAPPELAERRAMERGARVHVHLSAIGGAEWLLLPTPVARFGASFQLEFPQLTLGVDMRTSPSLLFEGGPTAGAAVMITPSFDMQLSACHAFALGPIQLGPCAQVGLGMLWAYGLNVPSPRARVVPVWTAGPAVRVGVPLWSVFELQAFVSARFGPRPEYYFEDGPPIVQTRPVGLDTGLGIGARW